MSKRTEKYSYLNGTQVSADLTVFLLGKDELMEKKVPHTVVAVLNKGVWTPKMEKWTAISVCWGDTPAQELILVGYEGQIQAGPVGNLRDEAPIDIDKNTGKVGFLKCARNIAGRVYIGGLDRQVYRRITGGFEAFDLGLPAGGEREVVSIEAIDGFDANEIYGVGRRGEIWRCDGKRWTQVSSPTNLILLGLHCAEDGFAYVCGQVGTVLRGRGDSWEIVAPKAVKEDFWDVAYFKGVVYLATRNVLYALKDGKLAPVDFGEADIPFTFYRFALSQDSLISIGSKDVMRFDGTVWSRID
jgi:hypothetical protein